MGIAYGFVCFNAILMIIGAFHIGFRIFSIYCTMCVCLLQLALLIASASLFFTKYNAVCSKSMTNTWNGYRWTMADDFQAVFGLWVASFPIMLGFCFCGLQSAYNSVTYYGGYDM